ncbi:MAG TPA: mannose-1-phosphate guanylyltransferase/mannose-6-phosphate isomerase [Allosphingosinicella sp.]|jgi:mannose-1-phosphate guanylyltransferase/mannose-1-phosphate guanylyltransferase/mannose-6-phosphate isomerase
MAGQRIQPVILSGGSGTRLWPLSVPERPKQLLALTGEETMIQLTAERVRDAERYAAPIAVCGERHADQVEAQLTAIGTPPALVIVEPSARNTAPAIALAALAAAPDDCLLVMPSDHVVADVAAFGAVVERALAAAADGWIVTFGIEPDRPETGYGYIFRGEALAEGVNEVERFVEKPDRATAEAYLAAGQCSWNSGIFLFRAGDYLEALERHAPDILAAVRAAVAGGRREAGRLYPEASAFARSPSISIDYAVMEKVERAAVAPVSMGWSDIGSWDALYDLIEKDAHGNALSGEVVAIGGSGSLIRTTGPKVAAIAVNDLIILATPEAVLVVPRGESQRVKEAVEAIERLGGGAK